MAMFLWTASISSALNWTEVRGVCAGVVAADAVLFFLEEELAPVSLKKDMLEVGMCARRVWLGYRLYCVVVEMGWSEEQPVRRGGPFYSTLDVPERIKKIAQGHR